MCEEVIDWIYYLFYMGLVIKVLQIGCGWTNIEDECKKDNGIAQNINDILHVWKQLIRSVIFFISIIINERKRIGCIRDQKLIDTNCDTVC